MYTYCRGIVRNINKSTTGLKIYGQYAKDGWNLGNR